ncbi:MAG: TRAP transporter large permease subunit [Deltaproteobacteria bacterium]|nr:MAG: TRAP transporter large permease subunit [Deltaproteobacteria bacterium]
MSGGPHQRDWSSGLTPLVVFALLTAMFAGLGPALDTRLVQLGENFWPGYAAELRRDPTEVPAECDLEALDAQLAECPPAGTAPAVAPGGDPFGGGDPFAAPGDAAPDPFAGGDPFAEPAPAPAPADPFAGDDPFAEPAPAPAPKDPFAGDDPFAEPAPKDPFAGDDPFAGGGDPFAEGGGDDPFAGGDPFAAAPAAPKVNCEALRAVRDRCAERHEEYAATMARITPSVKRFRSGELAVAELAKFPYWRHLLVLVVLLGGLVTTARRLHIALRNADTLLEDRVTQGTQLLAHSFVAFSAYQDWMVQQESTAEVENGALPILWGLGFLGMAGINVLNLVRPPSKLTLEPSTPVRLLMVIPLYTWMLLLGGVYFFGVEGHLSGQAIYLHKFVQHPSIYIGIGLYIWAGMLLAGTRVSERFLDVLMPWHFPPAMLAWLVVVFSALPTAYSGASGIFVIAAGAVIFQRLRTAGAGKRMALMATAMSGSLGVVLRPCLVVVLVAAFNKQVTTDELFAKGLLVFGLTATLFGIAMVLLNRDGFKIAPAGEAMPQSIAALRPLVPYVVIALAFLVFMGLLTDSFAELAGADLLFFVTAVLNERSAPLLLPGLMLLLVAWDRWLAFDAEGGSFKSTVLDATDESSSHIGALLMLMTASVGLGGVVERAELMNVVPDDLGSPFTTMVVLVLILVLVGMTMDAMGAVILVTVTVAQIAYKNGIDPVHFWMTVLVAFELGYLTPPVAINHLLARQVIGDEARVELEEGGTFFERQFHILVPMAVMGTALIIVAFGPLLIA